MAHLQFWFEFASTYSYLAAMRVDALAAAEGVHVTYHPFLLGPTFAAQGLTTSPFNAYPTKGKYMWRDMERLCEEYALPLKRPSEFPRNGLSAARIALANSGKPWLSRFVRDVYVANFAEDRDISRSEVLRDILAGLELGADSAEGVLEAATFHLRGGGRFPAGETWPA